MKNRRKIGKVTCLLCTLLILAGFFGVSKAISYAAEKEDIPEVTDTILYSIEFDENGADDGDMDTLTKCKAGEEYTLPKNEFVRYGYKFVGWNTEEDGTGDSFDDEATVKDLATKKAEVITLFAQWEIEKYTITYVLNKGTNSTYNPATYTIDDEITFLSPTKKGYSFKGWYTDTSYTTRIYSIPKASTGDVTVYAKWSKVSYAITYVLDGGTNDSSNPVKYTVTTTTFTFKDPAKEGYVFEGWYTDKNFTNAITQVKKGSIGKLTLYAKWTKPKYTITYVLNGGTNSTKNPDFYYTASSTISLKSPTRAGYTFKGWYSDSKYTTKITKIATGSSGDITLYAKWSRRKYSITYSLGGGTNNTKNPDYYYVTTSTITLSKPTKSGYVFGGWYTDSKYTEKVTSIPKGSTGNITLYAKWTGKSYTISLDANGGNVVENTIQAMVGQSVTLPGLSQRLGFRCLGWNTKADGTGKMYTLLSDVKNLTTKAGKTVTLYAIWERLGTDNNAFETPELIGNRQEDFVKTAGSQIGYIESDSGTPYATYMGHPTWPWCVYFVSWCAEKANIPTYVIPREGSTRVLRDFYIKRGRYYYVKGAIDGAHTAYMSGISGIKTIDPSEVTKGDLILQETNGNVSQGADHTAIAVKYDEQGEFFWCVAGNTGNRFTGYGVKYYKVFLYEVHGVCRPAW